jgi:hypothetical protein
METGNIDALANLANPANHERRTRREGDGSWFEALARAWGQTLDQQAARIQNLSEDMGATGEDGPSQIVDLTAESLRMQFLANSQSTSTNSVGQALESMARKQ